jgi:hydrogenase maturation factor
MCVTLAGRVVSISGEMAVVDIDGHHLTVSGRAEPDVARGDFVLVGLGSILARLDPTEAERFTADVASVAAAARPPAAEGGKP